MLKETEIESLKNCWCSFVISTRKVPDILSVGHGIMREYTPGAVYRAVNKGSISLRNLTSTS